jgi:hypothetical protein
LLTRTCRAAGRTRRLQCISLRFQISQATKAELAARASLKLGCDRSEHPQHIKALADELTASLLKDLQF